MLLGPFTAANYGLDFDDGTRNVSARYNVLYGGGHKNYEGQNKNASGNLFLYHLVQSQSRPRFLGTHKMTGIYRTFHNISDLARDIRAVSRYPELSDQLASFDRFQGCMASDGTPTNGETFEGNVCVVHEVRSAFIFYYLLFIIYYLFDSLLPYLFICISVRLPYIVSPVRRPWIVPVTNGHGCPCFSALVTG